jgi:nucleoid-associated protein YgaU
MQKDLKIGLVLGLTLVIASVLWLATRPSLSPEARMQQLHNTVPLQENSGLPDNFSTNEANNESIENNQFSIINNQSELPDTTIYEQEEKIKPQKFHIVCEGETLSKISSLYYGSGGKWQQILDSNRNTITDANKIKPGMKLIIPN